ncbi:MAG: NADH-quinone oxidoreductase subunit M, partial [Bacteroidota bacterium]
MEQHLLSLIIFLPLLASFLVLCLPSARVNAFRWITFLTTFVQLGLAIWIWRLFDQKAAGFQLVEESDWISMTLGGFGHLSIDYLLGIDGFSLPMLLLSALVLCIGAISSWTIDHQQKGYFALYLLLSSTIMGCFAALDFFLFYLFFEFMLLPMYFLIGIWGGPRKDYASIKFFLYTFGGSLFILLVMIGLYLSVMDPQETAVQLGLISQGGIANQSVLLQVQMLLSLNQIAPGNIVHTFDIRAMMDAHNYLPGSIFGFTDDITLFNIPARLVGFLSIFLGFAVKLPVVPVHTWLPDAHVEAPTPVSVILAGVLLKIGSYGFFRIAYGIFPDGAMNYAWWIGLVGMISIIYGAFLALAMNDLKKMIAYSSVSHMGFVLLGLASLTPEGVSGAIYQSFSHGILSALLFLLVGVLYDRTHDRRIDSYQGLASATPQYTVVVTVAFFASLGLPGFSGFVGELFTLVGGFHSGAIPRWMAAVSTLGIVLSAAYFLWTLQRIFFGKFWLREPDKTALLTDLVTREKLMLIPLVMLAIVFGLFPSVIFDMT